MPIWIAVLLGAVQGLAEFLPISSSGHLALVQALVDFDKHGGNALAFNIIVHLGTLTAVIIAFRKDVVKVIKAFLAIVLDKFKIKDIPSRRMVVMLIIACIPLVAGAFIDKLIEESFKNTLFIGIALLITAVMLFVADKIGGGSKTERDATYKDAAFVGVMQLFAVFPGISRSGATICGGLFSGFSRDFAVRFAFIMSIPAVLGSAVFKLPDLIAEGLAPGMALPYLAGFVTSAVCGYLAIWMVKTLMKKGNFKYFSIYCALVGLTTIIVTLVK